MVKGVFIISLILLNFNILFSLGKTSFSLLVLYFIQRSLCLFKFSSELNEFRHLTQKYLLFLCLLFLYKYLLISLI